MGVQTLHTLAGSAHPSRRSVANVVTWDRRITFRGVPAVGISQLGRLTGLLGGPDATTGLQGADP